MGASSSLGAWRWLAQCGSCAWLTADHEKGLEHDDKFESELAGVVSDVSSESAPELEWTAAEEARVVRKLDFTVLALLTFGFFCFQLERGNIANAVTSTLFRDVGITQDQFNTGQGLLFLGIVLLEVPSQMVVQLLGPQVWLTFQVFAFGTVATLQLFMHNYASFLGTRILLGVTECGYLPGALFVLSTFYKRSELSSRTAIFYMGSSIVSGVGGLMASGILRLGDHRLHAWQWLFLIEGSIALFCAVVFLLFLPDSPHRPRTVLGWTVFSARERAIVLQRVVGDDAHKAGKRRRLTTREVLSTLGQWRNYPHVLHATACIAATGAMSQYQPLLIKGFGFGTIRANALSSVGGWLSFVILLVSGFVADRFRSKGPIVIALTGCSLVAWIAFQAMSTSKDRWAKYATIVVTTAFSQSWHPQNATWLSLNQKTPQQRSIAMAMFIMAANLGGLVGSQILRANDAPRYPIGFRVCVCLIAVGLAAAIGQHFQYRWSNRKNDEARARGESIPDDRPERYTL